MTGKEDIKSIKAEIKPIGINCPLKLEVRYTRAEKAAEMYKRALETDAVTVQYGADTHTLFFEIHKVNRIPHIL